MPNTFLTFGVKPAPGETPTERANKARDAWPKMVRRMVAESKRDPDKNPIPKGPALDPERCPLIDGKMPRQVRLPDHKIEYLMVFETTKKGEPHIHGLARSEWIGQEWLSKNWGELTGAPVVDVRRIYDLAYVAFYVAKYIAKCPEKFEGCKRYWSSHGFELDKAESKTASEAKQGAWRIVYVPVDEVVDRMMQMGWVATKHRFSWMLEPP